MTAPIEPIPFGLNPHMVLAMIDEGKIRELRLMAVELDTIAREYYDWRNRLTKMALEGQAPNDESTSR